MKYSVVILLALAVVEWSVAVRAADADKPATADQAKDEKSVEIEQAKPRTPSGILGTMDYPQSDAEKKFLGNWSKAAEATDPDSLKTEDLSGKRGKGIGWFGIVREIKEDKKLNQTRLLLEMKYFDGLTDIDLQVVSIYGAGDFTAVLPGVGHKIRPLDLVRVYGTVVKDEKRGGQVVPEVQARYIRDWDWGLFTFMDYGNDKTNPKWKALDKVKGDESYSSNPDQSFYEERLGKRK